LTDDMLVKADRASMANSLEVRPFYLHPRITDFAFTLPVKDLVTYTTDKAFLKRFYEGKLPNENLYRSKMGFTFPLKELIQGELKPLFNQCIENLPEELINHEQLKKLLHMHTLGGRNYTGQLHSLMALGRWISKYS
jgi:asparagine synthase (glutamine-hydrolysing)